MSEGQSKQLNLQDAQDWAWTEICFVMIWPTFLSYPYSSYQANGLIIWANFFDAFENTEYMT